MTAEKLNHDRERHARAYLASLNHDALRETLLVLVDREHVSAVAAVGALLDSVPGLREHELKLLDEMEAERQ